MPLLIEQLCTWDKRLDVYVSCIQYPGTDPRQQVAKQGPGEPEAALEAAVIQAQLQENVVGFPKLCASGELDGPGQDL